MYNMYICVSNKSHNDETDQAINKSCAWIHECMMDTWIHDRYMIDTWIHGCMNTWIHGYMDTWIHDRYMIDTWIHGYMDT